MKYMSELVLALLFIFPPTAALLFYLAKIILTKKTQALLLNEKIAPFLFPLYLFLAASFRLEPVRNFLQWLGFSGEIAVGILIFAVVDNIFLFFEKENRIRKIFWAYAKYLKHDTSEFALVLILSFLCGLVSFFKMRAVVEYPAVLAGAVFISVLFFLPLILYHYHDLQLDLKFEIKEELLIKLIKLLFFIICPLLFLKLFSLLVSEASAAEFILVGAGWILESLLLYLFWKKIIRIPKLITESYIYQRTKTGSSVLVKKSLLFLYRHIEVTAVLLLLLVISWPLAMARIDEYRNWRSNFPVIKKAVPIVGMQGTGVILYGDNFGTTGLGVPGKVMVGGSSLITQEWNDHKIVAIVPVPPPNGPLYIRKRFMWDGKHYTTDSNKVEFKYFDWQHASQEDILNFLDVLKKQYLQKQ